MHLYRYLSRSQENDLNCLGEILVAFEFYYVLRSTFLGYLLFLTLGDFVRLNRQSGTKTVMRGEKALYLPIHPHVRLLVRPFFSPLLPSIPFTNQPHLLYSVKVKEGLKEPHPAKENPQWKRRQPIAQRVLERAEDFSCAIRRKDQRMTCIRWIIWS